VGSIPAASLHQALQAQRRGVVRARVVGRGSGGGAAGEELGCGLWHGGVTVGVPVRRAARAEGGAGMRRVPGLVRWNRYHSSGARMVRCQNCREEDAEAYIGVEHHGEKREETGDGELVIFFGTGDL
jgi:hypothetical protein